MPAPLRFRLARFLLRLILGTLLRVRVEGWDRLPPNGPYLLACNHLSWVDPFLLLGWLPASPRVHFLGRRSAVYNRAWKRWILRVMGGVIPVETGDLGHVSEAVGAVLRRGGVVAIFPEGRTGAAEGRLQPLRRGVAHFAAGHQVPVVAVGLAGTLELWRGKPVTIRVGRTLPPAEGLSADRPDDLAAEMAEIESALAEALPAYRDPGR